MSRFNSTTADRIALKPRHFSNRICSRWFLTHPRGSTTYSTQVTVPLRLQSNFLNFDRSALILVSLESSWRDESNDVQYTAVATVPIDIAVFALFRNNPLVFRLRKKIPKDWVFTSAIHCSNRFVSSYFRSWVMSNFLLLRNHPTQQIL